MELVLAILGIWAVLWTVNAVTIRKTQDDGCGGCMTVLVLMVGVLVAMALSMGG